MAEPTKAEIKQAIKAKKIDVPIMRVEKKGKTIILYLLGGRVVKYSPRPSSE